jgi:DNA-binding GntR family transcriptional regulator
VTAEPLEAASLVELTARRLRGEILSGELAPGERIVEEQLTRRFGTSRAPLREALRLLGQQGLVEHLPRRGVRVTQLSARDIDELFTLRDVLEQFAVRCALGEGGVPDPVGLEAMAAAVAVMERATLEGDALTQATGHRAFHLALVAMSGHRHLLDVYEPVILKLQIYMATNMRREATRLQPEEGPHRHRRLYDAVCEGDLTTVLAELEAHGSRTYLAPELGSV